MTDRHLERAHIGMYSFQSSEPRRLAEFWAELMDLDLLAADPDDDLIMLDPNNDHGPTWLFQRADVGPPATVPRLRIDITSPTEDGWRAASDRAVRAGATRLSDNDIGGVRWIEMTDVDDNPFRVFAPRPS